MPSLEICIQPECLLREEDVDSRSLAELIVRVVSGEDVSDLVAEGAPIEPSERCIECVLRIMRDAGPLPSVEEIERLLKVGRWSHRRMRRKVR